MPGRSVMTTSPFFLYLPSFFCSRGNVFSQLYRVLPSSSLWASPASLDDGIFCSSIFSDFAAKICLTHSFNLHTVDDYIGRIDISAEKMEELKALLAATEYDDYDRLIQLLDSACGADGTKNLETRMNDVKQRYGYYPQGKWDKNFELKAYFEKLMGRDFYEVI